MKLESVTISNYKSIKELMISLATDDNSPATFGLIGVNEAGKSAILQALALKDVGDKELDSLLAKRDFRDSEKPIEVKYIYTLTKEEKEEMEYFKTEQLEMKLKEHLGEIEGIPAVLEQKILKLNSLDSLGSLESLDLWELKDLLELKEKVATMLVLLLEPKRELLESELLVLQDQVVAITEKISAEIKKILVEVIKKGHPQGSLENIIESIKKILVEAIREDGAEGIRGKISAEIKKIIVEGIREKISETIDDEFNVLLKFEIDSEDKTSRTITTPILKNSIFDQFLNEFFSARMHRSILWTAEEKYLISKPIPINEFMNDPNISIPLKNCFQLAGIESANIKEQLAPSRASTEVEYLQKRLGEGVTEHINAIWPEHKIEITFRIDESFINFHIKDCAAKGPPQTTEQRSDGFRQFISFLLTISAENQNKKLTNSILLLDEPETHLHPQAQKRLLKELLQITQNGRNNIVIFATHSNHMIVGEKLKKYLRIQKKASKTIAESIEESATKIPATYASIVYQIFGVCAFDYHNELYGYLEAEKGNPLQQLPKTKKWYNQRTKKTENISLPRYIRHSIHHPENTENEKFTEEELHESITILEELTSTDESANNLSKQTGKKEKSTVGNNKSTPQPTNNRATAKSAEIKSTGKDSASLAKSKLENNGNKSKLSNNKVKSKSLNNKSGKSSVNSKLPINHQTNNEQAGSKT